MLNGAKGFFAWTNSGSGSQNAKVRAGQTLPFYAHVFGPDLQNRHVTFRHDHAIMEKRGAGPCTSPGHLTPIIHLLLRLNVRRIVNQKPAFEANLDIAFADGKRWNDMFLFCLEAGVHDDCFQCFMPGNDGFTMELQADENGFVLAHLKMNNEDIQLLGAPDNIPAGLSEINCQFLLSRQDTPTRGVSVP